MGPTCEVLLPDNKGPTLDAIDGILASMAERVQRTRKGRVWDVWIRGRPIHLQVDRTEPVVTLSAGCHAPEDTIILRDLAACIAQAVGGIFSEPEK